MKIKAKFRIYKSVLQYNYRYFFHPINKEAEKIGAYAMYLDGILRKRGFSMLQDKFR